MGYNCTPCWILVEETATEGENYVSFTPSRVYAVSKNEMYIAGNGLLYRYHHHVYHYLLHGWWVSHMELCYIASPNRGDTSYQLLITHQEYQIGSIAFSKDQTFAFTILSSEVRT